MTRLRAVVVNMSHLCTVVAKMSHLRAFVVNMLHLRDFLNESLKFSPISACIITVFLLKKKCPYFFSKTSPYQILQALNWLFLT